MENLYIKTSDDCFDQQGYLMEAIREALYCDNYESFGKRLWELAGWVTSQPAELPDKALVDEIVDQTIEIVKGAHFFLHHKERLGFEDSDIDRAWVPNPYRASEEYRRYHDACLNHHLAHWEERFQWLTKDEIQNFSLVFERFFSVLSFGDWLNLLENWRSFALDNEPVSMEFDFTPLKTYEQLAKLSEACFVALEWENCRFPPPNHHFYVNRLMYSYEDYNSANPLEGLNWLFYQYDIQLIKQDVERVFKLCKHDEQSELNHSVNDLSYCLICLLYDGWLLLQTDEYPEEWITSDKFYFFYYPKIDCEIDRWTSVNVTYTGRNDLPDALGALFYKNELKNTKDTIEYILSRYYDPKEKSCLDEDYIDKKRFILRLLDILFLINLDLCKRRTVKENVKYPKEFPLNKEIGSDKEESKDENSLTEPSK